jgi:hypothetical protein
MLRRAPTEAVLRFRSVAPHAIWFDEIETNRENREGVPFHGPLCIVDKDNG